MFLLNGGIVRDLPSCYDNYFNLLGNKNGGSRFVVTLLNKYQITWYDVPYDKIFMESLLF